MGIFTPKREKRAIVSSAARVQLDNRSEMERFISMREKDWQKRCWDAYEAIGELGFGIDWLADTSAKVELYVAEIDPDNPDAQPKRTEDTRAVAEFKRLENGDGIDELIRLHTKNFQVAGEYWLVGIAEREPVTADTRTGAKAKPGIPETWLLASITELERQDTKVTLKGGVDGKADIELDLEQDFLARAWVRHPKRRAEAFSPLRRVLSSCEELMLIEHGNRAAYRSRIARSGVLWVPDEATMAAADPTEDDEDPLVKEFIEVASTNILNEEDASAVVPVVVRGPTDGKPEFLSMEQPLADPDGTRKEALLRRIAQGTNQPVEVIFGLGEANHWGAGQIELSAFNEYMEPNILALCGVLTKSFLQPNLEEAGLDAKRFVVWYDASKIVVQPTAKAEAKEAHAAGAISDQALRERYGFEDEDAPSEEEQVRRAALQRGAIDPMLMQLLLAALLNQQVPDEEPDDEEPPEPPEEEPEPEAAVIAAAPPANVGQRLTEIDRSLKMQLHPACDAVVARALERAGAKVRSKARANRTVAAEIRGLDATQIPSVLGREAVTALGIDIEDLFGDAFGRLKDQFTSWSGRAQRAALDLVPSLGAAQRKSAEAVQQADLEEAWVYLEAALTKLATDRLFDPSPDAPELGELDDAVLVPYGIVRGAVARAGGAQGLEDGVQILIQGGTQPAGGIGTGQVILGLFGEQGFKPAGFEWVYGAFPRSRPFEPHMALDGVAFQNWDDEVLTNTSGWPYVSHYMPGDHDGCSCDWTPVIEEAGRAAA